VTITATEQPPRVTGSDPAELLIKEAREESRRRRVRRISLVIVAAVVTSLAGASVRSQLWAPSRATKATVVSRSSSIRVPPCALANVLLIDRGSDVAMGSWIQLFQLKNIGARACPITGYPRISLETSQGLDRSLAVTVLKYQAARQIGDSRPGPIPTSDLAARGGVASFWILGSDTPLRHLLDCRSATRVVVAFSVVKGDLVHEVGRIPFSYCENQIIVTPVLPGGSGSLPVVALRYFDLEG